MTTMTINGRTLAYDDAGRGNPPILFVHGWGGRRAEFGPQVAHFSQTNRVVAVDRTGHGESDAPEIDYTIEMMADELAAVCRELGLDRAVVVQHSFDRLTYDFAARYPELVRAVCIIDGPTLAGPMFDDAAAGFLAGLESDEWQAAVRGFAEQLVFAPGWPEEMKEEAIGGVLQTPRHVLVSAWRSFVGYDSEAALRQITCPLLYVGGQFPADLDRLAEICPQVEVRQIPGQGHHLHLTASDEFNAVLGGFVASLPVAAG